MGRRAPEAGEMREGAAGWVGTDTLTDWFRLGGTFRAHQLPTLQRAGTSATGARP